METEISWHHFQNRTSDIARFYPDHTLDESNDANDISVIGGPHKQCNDSVPRFVIRHGGTQRTNLVRLRRKIFLYGKGWKLSIRSTSDFLCNII